MTKRDDVKLPPSICMPMQDEGPLSKQSGIFKNLFFKTMKYGLFFSV